MEDFCQLDLRLTADKYKGSYERCAKIIEKYSSRIVSDLTELFIRLIFSFLCGNSDMHLKNFSLISENGKKYHLSEAYDLLSVSLDFDDQDEMALTLNGKNRNLHRGDFLKYGEAIGLRKEVCQKLIERMVNQVPGMIDICSQSYLNDELKEKWISLVTERSERLKK